MKVPFNAMSNIDKIFKNAEKEGRNTLYEYEVYLILKEIGMDIPNFEFIQTPEELNQKMLEKFGQDIVVKIVSMDISHKQKLGGVKVIKNYDEMFVQYVLQRMKDEVLDHFNQYDNKPDIKGFLIVEYIPHTKSIGYEILIGIKDDPAFGPVITLSKGGDDAEFFAKYYDPANLFLPHLSYEEATKLVNSLKLRHKFNSMGHSEYLDFIAKSASVLSSFAYNYSYVAEDNIPNYIIKELDINPFVITDDNRFIAVDGFGTFEKSSIDEKNEKIPNINTKNINSFFNPKGVAVIGVSSNLEKYSMGREIVHLLQDLGRDDVYCINPKGNNVKVGCKTYNLYTSLDELPESVELAIYTAPAQYAINFFKSLNKVIPKSVVMIPGIPSNMEYSEFSNKLKEVVPKDTRIIGPNGMGVFYAPDELSNGVNTLFIGEERLKLKYSDFSNTVLLSQSGGIAITSIDNLSSSMIFKSIISFGNKYDVKIVDLLKYFNKNNKIDVIAIYVEGFDNGEGRRFFDLAKDIEKPIIIYKGGKNDAGAKAAASHTASMAGDYAVFKAVCEQAGVVLVESLQDYYDYLKTFSLLAKRKINGNKVMGVVNAGFESTVAADEISNLEFPKLNDNTVKKLEELNNHGLVNTGSPILDLTAMSDDVHYSKYIKTVLDDDNVDCLFVSVIPHVDKIKSTPKTCHDKDSLANLLVDIYKKYDKPIVVSVNGGEYYHEFVSIMEKEGIPVYNNIKSAVKSLDAYINYHLKK